MALPQLEKLYLCPEYSTVRLQWDHMSWFCSDLPCNLNFHQDKESKPELQHCSRSREVGRGGVICACTQTLRTMPRRHTAFFRCLTAKVHFFFNIIKVHEKKQNTALMSHKPRAQTRLANYVSGWRHTPCNITGPSPRSAGRPINAALCVLLALRNQSSRCLEAVEALAPLFAVAVWLLKSLSSKHIMF